MFKCSKIWGKWFFSHKLQKLHQASYQSLQLIKNASFMINHYNRGTKILLIIAFSVHIKVDEKVSLTAGRHGGLQNMEVRGMALLRISDTNFARISLIMENNDNRSFQMQVCWIIFLVYNVLVTFIWVRINYHTSLIIQTFWVSKSVGICEKFV